MDFEDHLMDIEFTLNRGDYDKALQLIVELEDEVAGLAHASMEADA